MICAANTPGKADEGQMNIILLLLKNKNKAFKSRITHPSNDPSRLKPTVKLPSPPMCKKPLPLKPKPYAKKQKNDANCHQQTNKETNGRPTIKKRSSYE